MSFSRTRGEQERQRGREWGCGGERENTSSTFLDSLWSLTPRRSVSKWLFYGWRWGKGFASTCVCVCVCVNILGYLCVSFCVAAGQAACSQGFVCARAPLCQRAVDVFVQNFTATSPSARLLRISPCYPSAGLSCHYSLSIHREVIVGKKPIRWAGRRIIEVMIGAVQRQLIVMEAGGGERESSAG